MEQINEWKKQLEKHVNEGEAAQAIQLMRRLKEANCELKFTIEPIEEVYTQNQNENINGLVYYGAPKEVAVEIALEFPDWDSCYREAYRNGHINRS